ncbi:MAG TPA: VTT domain-containing protein [Gemmatimonadaceae bacterium]|nr:VTT domain-containing protein [Gemmatimonadaceae bacterium]
MSHPAPSPAPASNSPTGDPPTGTEGKREPLFVRLIAWLHRIAESGWSRTAVLGWGVLNGSVVPGPSDAVLVPLGLADCRRIFDLMWWAIAGSVVGGLVAYGIGAFAFKEVGEPLLAWLNVSAQQVEELRGWFNERGWIAVVIGSLPMASPKLASIAAGLFGVPVLHFTLAILGVRTARFLLVAILLRYAGSAFARWFERRIGHPIAAPSPAASKPGR